MGGTVKKSTLYICAFYPLDVSLLFCSPTLVTGQGDINCGPSNLNFPQISSNFPCKFSISSYPRWQDATFNVTLSHRNIQKARKFVYPFVMMFKSCGKRANGFNFNGIIVNKFTDGVWVRQKVCKPSHQPSHSHQPSCQSLCKDTTKERINATF